MAQTLTCLIADALERLTSLCQMFLLTKGPPLFASLNPEGLSLEICLPAPTMLRQACRPARPCLLASSPPPILPWMEAFWQYARPPPILPWVEAERQYARPPPIFPQMDAERQYANSGVTALVLISAAIVTLVAAVFVYSRHATVL